jgi:hypothetical protein
MNPGMMGGYGYGMGPQMMRGYGCGMGPGMMGYYSPEQYEKQFKNQQEFLDATKGLRKKMHELRCQPSFYYEHEYELYPLL